MTCEAPDPPVDLTGPDLEAASFGSSKRSHRPADDIWDHFKKVKLDPATAKIQHRNYNAVCKGCDNTLAGKPEIMKRHLVNCSKASTHSQQDAIRCQAKRSASDISEAGSQQSGSSDNLAIYVDKAKVTPYQKMRWGAMLLVAFVMAGWPFRTVETPEFVSFMSNVRPNYQLPSAYVLSGVCLDAALATVRLKQDLWMRDVNRAYHLSLTLDGWSNDRMESIYSWNVIFPDRKVILLRADDLSEISHTGEALSDMIIKEILKWGPDKFAAIVTDNAKNMVKTRRLVIERFPHMIEIRCMMHAMSTTMASVMGHPYATGMITQAQKLVTFFRASHQPLALLKKLAHSMGIKRMLITSNKTRFTSVHASLESVARLQGVLQEIAHQQPALLSKAVIKTINNDMFFVRLKQLCRLLEPFSLVIAAVQAARCTLADVMRYWLFLAKQVTGDSSDGLPPGFKAHCFVAYNIRHEEMVTPWCKVALFVHPLYRDVVSQDKASWVLVQQKAGGLWKDGYKNSKQAVQQLITDMKHYKIHDAPFDSMPADGELATLKLYWKSISSSNEQLELPKLALLLLDIKPHAADPEKTVSLMGWYHSARRSQLLSRTTTAMTTIKMHYQPVKDRAEKSMRTVEDIMLREQELAEDAEKFERERKAEEDAAVMAVGNPAAALDRTIERGAPVNAADSMELCSTAEIVELFGEYYDADVEQQQNDYLISDSRTSTDLDFDHPALTQVTAPPPIARVQLGDNTEQYDLDNLVSKD